LRLVVDVPGGTDAPGAADGPDGAAGADVAEVQAALCGHRNIGNKTCVRPAGHPEKNHRYK